MNDKTRFNLDDLARQLAQSLPQNLRALGGDLERNFRSLLHSGLERMDLVTREEFDVQAAVLERTREKLERLENRLAELEVSLGDAAGAGSTTGTTGTTGAAPGSTAESPPDLSQ